MTRRLIQEDGSKVDIPYGCSRASWNPGGDRKRHPKTKQFGWGKNVAQAKLEKGTLHHSGKQGRAPYQNVSPFTIQSYSFPQLLVVMNILNC